MDPPVNALYQWDTEKTIVYNVYNGAVYGGSDPKRILKHQARDEHGFYPECIYKMELDLLNRTFIMEFDNEKIMIDSKIGDFDFSPIVMFGNYKAPVQITVL